MALVGIDIGSQSLKAVVLGDDLALRGAASTAYPVDYPRPGWAEQAPAAWEAALGPSVAAALGQAGVAAAEVVGLGVAGQLDGCVAVDGAGRALGPCLLWMDRRATAELPELPLDFRALTGQVADPSHMAAKIAWLRRHGGLPRGARFHQPVSYLVERLTSAFVFDHGLASTTMLYDLAARALSPALLAAFAITPGELPAIADAGAVAGPLSADGARLVGLPVGISVAVGTGDDFATPLGAGLVGPGRVVCVLGTAEVVGALADRPIIDPGGLVETHAYPAPGWLVENPGWLAGGALTWLATLLGLDGADEIDRLAAEAPPGSDGVIFLPALAGAMAPAWNPLVRGCFYGLSPAHDRRHLCRAVLEGCAFAMRDVVDRLRELAIPTESLLLVGGGARSRTWAAIRADATGLAAHCAEPADTCAIGAALLGGVAARLVPSLERGAAALAGGGTVVAADPAHRPAYDDAHARYRALYAALAPSVQALSM